MPLDERAIEKWARLLAGYCLDVKPGETVGIFAEIEARPLVEACYRAVVDRGGHPLLRLSLPGLSEYFLNHAPDDRLAELPTLAYYEAETLHARIRISAETDPAAASAVDPARQALRDRALGRLRNLMRRNRWVLTQYPTDAYAADARMTRDEYDAFVARAMFLDAPDPAERWRALGARQQSLVDRMRDVGEIRVQGPDVDISMSVRDRTWINSDGRRNMPSGEIFTGPLENSVNGRFKCAHPVRRDGRELVGVELEFQNGEVVRARAETNEPYLRAMLELDPGARRIGELGIGLNPGIDRFTGSILYDEKIGGTVHLALGQSYPETGGVNASSLHWDLILDLRAEGRILADGRLVFENGNWLVG